MRGGDGAKLARWAVLGRLLPRRTRVRIFEPAFNDLLRGALESQRATGLRFVGGAFAVLGGSVRIALWRALLSYRVLIALLVVVIVFLLLIQSWVAQMYAAGGGGQGP